MAPLLLAAAALCPLAYGRRGAAVAAAVTICILAWMFAPFTGGGEDPLLNLFALSTVRYLMPAIALATGVLAVVASRPGAPGYGATLVLAVAAVWGAIDLLVGRDGVLGAPIIAGAAAAGAVAAWALSRAEDVPDQARRWRTGAAAAASLAIVALALYPGAFLDRYSAPADVDDPLYDTRATFGGLAGWFEAQPEFRDGSEPVLFQPRIVGPLTGGTFAHPLLLIQPGTACEEIEANRDGGWVVLDVPGPGFGGPPDASRCFDAPPVAAFPTASGGELRVYGDPERD